MSSGLGHAKRRRHAGAAVCAFAALAAVALASSESSARGVIDVDVAVEGDLVQAALRLVARHRGRLGADDAQLAVAGTTALRGGKVVRIAQRHDGLPVIGAEVAVLLLHGRALALTGELRRVGSVTSGPLISAVDAARALRRANRTAVVHGARLAIRPGDPSRRVWVLRAITTTPYELWRVEVDAVSGQLLFGLPDRSSAAEGYVYTPNPKVGRLARETLVGLRSEAQLRGELADVETCGYEQNKLVCRRLAKSDARGDFFYEPREGTVSDAFSEVQAYYHVDLFQRWLLSRFKFKRAASGPQHVVVNLHRVSGSRRFGVSNAFFGDVDGDGDGDLVFGQGNRDFAYDADVIYHEFGHAVIAETSRLRSNFDELGFNEMPSALNESAADLLSSMFTNDAVVGDYAGGDYGHSGIRDLAGKPLHCPDDLYGESHHDGLIWGRAVWAMRGKVGDRKKFDDVVYKVLAGLSTSSSMADAGALLSKVAKATDAKLAKIVDAQLEAARIIGCKRIVKLAADKEREGYLLGTSSIVGSKYMPAALQYRIDVPAAATKMTLSISARGHGFTRGGVGAFVRRAKPVSFKGTAPVRDFTVDTTDSELVLERGDRSKPLRPGTSYYLLPLNVDRNALGYKVLAEFELEGGSTDGGSTDGGGDAGPISTPAGDGGDGQSPDGDGCSLAADGGGETAGVALLLLGLFVLSLRRRGA